MSDLDNVPALAETQGEDATPVEVNTVTDDVPAEAPRRKRVATKKIVTVANRQTTGLHTFDAQGRLLYLGPKGKEEIAADRVGAELERLARIGQVQLL